MLIDSHIHLTHPLFRGQFPYVALQNGEFVAQPGGTRETVIARIKDAGVAHCVEPAIGLRSNPELLAFAESQSGFLCPAVGVHPTRTYREEVADAGGRLTRIPVPWSGRKLLEQYAEDPAVVAIGETGLDYHNPRAEQHRLRQAAWFLFQLRLAHRRSLPVILHVREADRDALRILRLFRKRLHGGVCHCFNGDAATANRYTELGLFLGIGGALLCPEPNREALEQAVRATPLEALLLETDGPFVRPPNETLSKKQWKKTRNTSLILPAVARRIAELKGVPAEEVERVTAQNAIRLFGLEGTAE